MRPQSVRYAAGFRVGVPRTRHRALSNAAEGLATIQSDRQARAEALALLLMRTTQRDSASPERAPLPLQDA